MPDSSMRDGDPIASTSIAAPTGSGSVHIPKVQLVDATGKAPTATTSPQVQGNVAAGATDSGNPVKAGAVVATAATSYTAGQRGDLQMLGNGALLVTIGTAATSTGVISPADANSTQNGLVTASRGQHFNGSTWDRSRGDTNGTSVQTGLSSTWWNYAAATGGIVNTTTAVTIKAAAGASVRNFLTTLTIAHDTLGAATEIAVRDGAGGTVLWRGRLQTAATDSAGGSGAISFDPPLKGTANTLMEVVTLTAVTGGVYVSATGYTGA